jgi:hypothetical protein
MPIPFLLAVNGDNTSPRAENRWALRLRLRLRDGKQFRYGKPPTGAWCELVLVSLSIVTGGSDGGVTAERNENGCTCVTGECHQRQDQRHTSKGATLLTICDRYR